jgi:superfamily I DNA/RNA helicase
MHPPTPEQSDILSIISDCPRDSIMSKDFAGTGKTATIEMICKQMPRHTSTLVLAFNVDIASELKKRLEKTHCDVRTMNSLGLLAYRMGIHKNPQLDNNKPYRLLRQIIAEEGLPLPKEDQPIIISMYKSAMIAGLVPSDFPNETMCPDLPEIWQSFEPFADDTTIFTARLLLIRSIQEGLTGIISFDDQIYLSVLFGGKFPRFACVLVDEAQDLSILNHKMVEKCAVSRIMCFGDELQSIYFFRTKTSNSFRELQKLRPIWQHKPLTMSFRCPKLIVERNAHHAFGFRAAPDNPQGSFRYHNDPWSIPEDRSVAVLCRNNAPLLSLAFKLLKNRIPVTFLGKDIGKSLISLFNKICPDKSTPIDQIAQLISDWESREKVAAGDDESKKENIGDRAACLLTIIDSECRSARDFLFKLESIFSSKGEITLSTIHRAKGLEWDTVYHLDPWRLDQKRLLDRFDKGNLTEEQLSQEFNSKYVLETRTKNNLIEAPINLFTFK